MNDPMDEQAETLESLGFGPEAALLREPRLFSDRRFLGALVAEFEDELGPEGARAAFFQIGLFQGLRDAGRVVRGEYRAPQAEPAAAPAEATPLAIRFGGNRAPEPGAIEISGAWPECFEATARLSKLGPDECPSCALSAGYTSGWLSGTLDADVLAVETECAARGDEHCAFVAREVGAWRDVNDPRVSALLQVLSYETCRDAADVDLQGPGPGELPPSVELPDTAGSFDPDEPVVHLWGPVMVLPFTSPDEALRTADMLGRDPETARVRAVVLDLRNNVLDEGFAAAALEQVLETLESWGAESILTGVSPLSEGVVAGLETRHLLLRKDLPEAIATAFQIAEAQRYLL